MKSVQTVGIVGAGTMGRRIAFSCITCGIETRVYDISSGVSEEAVAALDALIEEGVERGQFPGEISEKALRLISIRRTLSDCVSGVDLVIEAIPESVELKRRVFSEIDRHINLETWVGSNTSSIPGSELADVIKRPERFFNFNFGSTDDLKVEVMGHAGTTEETMSAAIGFVIKLGLIPIRVRREIRGYAGNRIWRAIKKEVLFLIGGGYATAQDIDRGWMLDWGTDIGPCGLMDQVGLDVVRDIENVFYHASGDPSDRPPQFLLDMIDQGQLGVKSGAGFYKYPNPPYEDEDWLKKPKPGRKGAS